MSKSVKYILTVLVILLLIYLSLDIQKLDEYNMLSQPVEFDATEFAENFWEESVLEIVVGAPEIAQVLEALSDNPKEAFETYGRKLGISTTYYFIVNGEGIVDRVEDEYLVVELQPLGKVKIATDFSFGNAVRDGSGKVNINEFINMTDFNNVSVEINKLIKQRVVAELQQSSVAGKSLKFTGAMEINVERINLADILLLPVSCKISDGKTE